MKKYLKEHPALRITLISVLFVIGMILIFAGWKMTGRLSGLGIMLAGLVLLLVALYFYNKPFTD